ncbi:hypothetical protein KGM_202448 [Danaus plexippus plexippus]|uniref:Uncharacterized protein n=1 Tax=Danaus plexippus plexippus TaxID=278856 RepID=A0A212FN69_DANPL|nr:hypothetical protein KGM_202448 [Danaus plexippus plexippus]
MYNSDTVYSTTTFRPISASPTVDQPVRTRKLETPLHFDGGLFSDIRSTDGKLLSKVTVDRVSSSTRRDVIDTPHVFETEDGFGNKGFVDDIVKTEKVTNEDIIKVKFTPVRRELDSIPSWSIGSGSEYKPAARVDYLNNDYEDLQSYKIVNSLCKQKISDHLETETDKEMLVANVSTDRGHSPLANFVISDHLVKIENYLQESLDICSETKSLAEARLTPEIISTSSKPEKESVREDVVSEDHKHQYEAPASNNDITNPVKSYQTNEVSCNHEVDTKDQKESYHKKSKLNSVKTTKQGLITAMYNMPMHYHAAMICFVLVVYNLFHQYVKQNFDGNNRFIN